MLCSGIDRGGADLPRAFLEYLFDAITTNEIRTNLPRPTGAVAASSAAPAPTSAPAVAASGSPFPHASASSYYAPLAGACYFTADADSDGPSDEAAFVKGLGDAAHR